LQIRFAGQRDFDWLNEADDHISPEVLEAKIAGNEVYILEESERIGWLRYNLF
jgi:hypothetical protein